MGYHFSVKWFNYISNSNISNSFLALQLLLEWLLPWLFMNFFVCRLSLYNYVHIVYVHECEIRSPYLHTCFFLFLLDYNHKRLATNMLFTWADYKDMAFDFFSVQTNVVLSVTYVVPSKQCHLIIFLVHKWQSSKH